jgi:manganese/zinc/iron transport system substrate-binding protein
MKHTRILVLVAALLLAVVPFVSAQDEPINVVATTGMIADIIHNVGGEHVEIHQLMGAGVDPHLYRATDNDVDLLIDAEIIFYNGLNLEARLTDIFEQIGEDRPVVAVAENIPEEQLLKSPRYEDAPDPHVWMDVELWMIATEAARDALVEFDPANEADYTANAETYLEELTELDTYVQEQIESVPEEQRVLVTAHDAFQYYGQAYGIEVYAPQGISTETEAGIADIRRMIDLIKERQIPAIFVETSVPPDVVEAIIAGVEDAGQTVSIGGSLYSDAMGEPETEEGTYIGMIRHNTDTIVSALLGETAE